MLNLYLGTLVISYWLNCLHGKAQMNSLSNCNRCVGLLALQGVEAQQLPSDLCWLCVTKGDCIWTEGCIWVEKVSETGEIVWNECISVIELPQSDKMN